MDWKSSGCLLNLTNPDGTPMENDVASLQCIPILFGNILNVALVFSGAVALAFIILAGYKFINSGGDPKQLDGAKKTATYAIIGLVLVLLSFAIINFIAAFTGAECIKTFAFDSCATEATSTSNDSSNVSADPPVDLSACTPNINLGPAPYTCSCGAGTTWRGEWFECDTDGIQGSRF